MKKSFIILYFLIFSNVVFSQTSNAFLGIDLPLYYTIGYEQKISNHFSVNAKLGFLTKPFDVTTLDVLKAFGTDELVVNTIGEVFSVGINLQPSVKWHFHKSYIGVSYSYLSLNALNCTLEEIEKLYGVEIPDTGRNTKLSLHSNLQNAGLLYGRKFSFKNPSYGLNLELSILKTFYSSSRLETNHDNSLDVLNTLIDFKLNEYYINYGYIPGINIVFVYYIKNK
jgi:hypothetical protein